MLSVPRAVTFVGWKLLVPGEMPPKNRVSGLRIANFDFLLPESPNPCQEIKSDNWNHCNPLQILLPREAAEDRRLFNAIRIHQERPFGGANQRSSLILRGTNFGMDAIRMVAMKCDFPHIEAPLWNRLPESLRSISEHSILWMSSSSASIQNWSPSSPEIHRPVSSY